MVDWCAFDCEGRVDKDGVTAASIATNEGTYYTTNPGDAISVLRHYAARGFKLVAHNAEYDISVLLWQYGENVKQIYLNGRFNRGEWKYGDTEDRCQIWNSQQLAGGLSLAEVGKSIGLEKYETPQGLLNGSVDKYKWKCERHDNWECLECYAVRDSEIVLRYMEQYERFMLDFGCRPERTIGSSAVGLWRKLDNPSPCYLRSVEYAQFARVGYFGGRTECFKVGNIGPVHAADVTSMYPSVMLTTPMPKPETTNFYDGKHLSDKFLYYPGCADVTIYVPVMYVPPLPVYQNNKLLFPVGRIRGVWCTNEIRHALEVGCRIIKIHKVLYSKDEELPFTNYVTTLYDLRAQYKARKNPQQLTVKILLNSLYGRMGLGATQDEEIIEPLGKGRDFRHYKGKLPIWVGDDYYVQTERERASIPKFANVLWASIITAEARLRLHRFMVQQGSNLVYVDTDSIYSLEPIHGMSGGLGALSDDGYWDECRIIAPKIYRVSRSDGTTKLRVKGVPRRYAEEFFKHNEVTIDHCIRPKESLTTHKPAGSWVTLTKRERMATPKRNLIDPEEVNLLGRWSDTTPPWMYEEYYDELDDTPDDSSPVI